MSTPDKPDHARGWRYVEKLLDEEDRVANLSYDELQAELRREAEPERPPGTEWSADDLLARAEALAAQPAAPVPVVPKVAPVVPIRRTWRTVGLLAAACFALFLLVKLTQGPDIVGHPRSNRALAEAERDQAEASCALKDWAACRGSLDEAAKLDPEGESEPRVRKARQEIAAGMVGGPPEGGREKPGP